MRITIPGTPVAKARPRFNRKTGIAYTPKKTKSFETLIREIAYEQIQKPHEGAVSLSISFYFPRPKSKTYKRKKNILEFKTTRPDLDNLCKAVIDGLNGIAFKDDSQIVMLHARKYICGEEDTPHTEIIINFL